MPETPSRLSSKSKKSESTRQKELSNRPTQGFTVGTNAGSSRNSERLKLAGLIAAMGVAVAATLGYCSKDEKTSDSQQQSSSALDDSTDDSTLESSSINELPKSRTRMPKVSINEDAPDFDVPEGIKMTPSEFKAEATRLASFAVEKVASFIKVKLDEKDLKQSELFKAYIKILHDEAMKNPAFKSYFGNMDVDASREVFFQVVEKLKKILLAGNLYVDAGDHVVHYNGGIGMKSTLEVYQITDVDMVNMSEGDSTVEFPVITTGNGYIYDVDDTSVARYDGGADLAFFRKIQAGKMISEGIQDMSDKGLGRFSKAELDGLWIDYIRDTKIHEATHALVAKKYPKYGSYSKADLAFEVNLNVPLPGGDGKFAMISGEFYPVNFTELCAVGNELFQTKATIPYSFLKYLGMGNKPNELGYEIIGTLLPLYTLEVLKDSPGKRAIVNKLQANMPMDTLDFVKLANESLTSEEINKIGEMLYKQGKELFEQAEAGRLRVVKK